MADGVCYPSIQPKLSGPLTTEHLPFWFSVTIRQAFHQVNDRGEVMTDSRNTPGSSSGFNRRDFFRGTGVAAAATALQARSDEVIQSRSATVIRGPQKIVLNVNIIGKNSENRAHAGMT